MLRIRSGPSLNRSLLGGALILVLGVGPVGCGTSSPRRPAITPAEEARHRVQVLREQGRALTPEQVSWVERLPFRSSGPTDIPRALREGIQEPSVPLGERRSLLEQYRGDEEGDGSTDAAPRTGEEPSVDPQW